MLEAYVTYRAKYYGKWRLIRNCGASEFETLWMVNVLICGSYGTSPSHSPSLLPNPALLVLDRIEHDTTRFRLIVHVDQERACAVRMAKGPGPVTVATAGISRTPRARLSSASDRPFVIWMEPKVYFAVFVRVA
jgi:hypothetical protein